MADNRRLLDVWIVDLNSVYREVPFNVVADWLQQGRLLGTDRVRLAGGKGWHTLSKVSAFAPYLPRPEPLQAEDQAEALAPVDLGLDWKKPEEGEDEDVDMIPLIDISLVLLIFFMMTASVSSGFLSLIETPPAKHQLGAIAKNMWWIGIEPTSRAGTVEKGPDGQPLPWLSLGLDTQELVPPTTQGVEVWEAFAEKLRDLEGEVRVRLRADQSLPIEVIRGVTVELQGLEQYANKGREPGQRIVLSIVGDVSEPPGS